MAYDDNTLFHIARGGATFGPYIAADVRRHLTSGDIVATDIARSDEMQEWLPVAALFPEAAAAQRLGGLPRSFPNPPNLPWWAALLLEVVTLSIFFVVWDVVEAWWMHRVRPRSHALVYYVIVAMLFVLLLPANVHSVMHAFFDQPLPDAPYSFFFGVAALLLRLVARFSLRRSLLEHFNGPEPIGLHLSWWMTFFFGGLYFQYHFNRINSLKRQLLTS